MGKGSYLGGHTVVGPRSGWFSKSLPKQTMKALRRKQRLKAMSPEERAKEEEQAREKLRLRAVADKQRAEKAAAERKKQRLLQAEKKKEAAERRMLKEQERRAIWEATRDKREAIIRAREEKRLGSVKVFVKGSTGRVVEKKEGLLRREPNNNEQAQPHNSD